MEKQEGSFEQLAETEKELLLRAPERYGAFFYNAYNFVNLMNNLVKTVDDPNKYLFIAFLSQVKKHLTLALFSALRLHHVQKGLNLRQVLEASSWAAYAMAFKEKEKFCEKDTMGIVRVPKKLKEQKNLWLDGNFKIKSDEIKKMKEAINETVAHANIVYVFQNFKAGPAHTHGFQTLFFDFEDEYMVKTDLWSIANTAQGLIDLFIGVNQKYKVFTPIDNFHQIFWNLISENEKLKEEIKKHPRYINAEKRNKDGH